MLPLEHRPHYLIFFPSWWDPLACCSWLGNRVNEGDEDGPEWGVSNTPAGRVGNVILE